MAGAGIWRAGHGQCLDDCRRKKSSGSPDEGELVLIAARADQYTELSRVQVCGRKLEFPRPFQWPALRSRCPRIDLLPACPLIAK